jgi:LysR family transcriptional regulator, regulator for bpeEF and oprC
MLDLLQLDALIAVADCGSLAKAARRTGHPKSTLSKRLEQLENTLGVRVLERAQRAVRLNDDGAALVAEARTLIEQARSIEAGMKDRSGRLDGRIRISVPVLLGQTLLPPILGRFASNHPLVDIEVVPEDRYVDLVSDGFDCAIRLGPGRDGDLIRRKLAQSALVMVAPASYREALVLRQPAEIAGLETIGFGSSAQPEVWNLYRGTETVSVVPQSRLRLANLPAILAALAGYDAIALLPHFLVSSRLASGELVRVCPDWLGDRYDIAVVFPSRRYVPARVRALIEMLVEETGRLIS